MASDATNITLPDLEIVFDETNPARSYFQKLATYERYLETCVISLTQECSVLPSGDPRRGPLMRLRLRSISSLSFIHDELARYRDVPENRLTADICAQHLRDRWGKFREMLSHSNCNNCAPVVNSTTATTPTNNHNSKRTVILGSKITQ